MVSYTSQKNNSKLVYSTDPDTKKPEHPADNSALLGDDTVYLRREVKGRGGKQVTTLSGLKIPEEALKSLAGDLKRHCGTGGTSKDGIIIIQGDQRDKIEAFLRDKGLKVKKAGG